MSVCVCVCLSVSVCVRVCVWISYKSSRHFSFLNLERFSNKSRNSNIGNIGIFSLRYFQSQNWSKCN